MDNSNSDNGSAISDAIQAVKAAMGGVLDSVKVARSEAEYLAVACRAVNEVKLELLNNAAKARRFTSDTALALTLMCQIQNMLLAALANARHCHGDTAPWGVMHKGILHAVAESGARIQAALRELQAGRAA